MGERLRSLNAKYEEKLEQKDKEAAEKLQRLPRGKDSKLSPSLEKFFREVYSPNKKVKDVSSKDVQKGETDDEEDDDGEIKEFKAEADTLSSSESASAKKTIASVLKGQFEEIYEEAKDELSK